MKMILKEQNIQISFGSIVTKMANLRYVVQIFLDSNNFLQQFFKRWLPSIIHAGRNVMLICSQIFLSPPNN